MRRQSCKYALLGLGAILSSAAAAQATAADAAVDAAVLSHAIEKGQVLSAHDFTSQKMGAGAARGALTAAQAAGLEAARRLDGGKMVRAYDVVRAQLVRRGEPVTITLIDGPLSISAEGRALSGGSKGEMVRVVNSATNITIDAQVEATGVVRLAPRQSAQ